MDHPIFISYSTQDKEIAFKIVQYLEGNGHTCWIAPRNITSGMDYTDVINEAIEDCSALVLVFSEHSVKSQFVKKELTTAVSYNKTILPFKISEVELKGGFLFMLNNVQWIDATSRPESKFPQIIDGLEGRMSAPDHSTPNTAKTKSAQSTKIMLIAGAVIVAVALLLLLLIPKGEENGQPAADTVPQAETPAVEAAPKADTVFVEVPSKEKPATSPKDTKGGKVKENDKGSKAVEPEAAAAPEPEPVKMAEPVAEPAPAAAPAKTTANDRAQKMGRARRYLNNKKYQAALTIFEELKREDPSDKALDALINECRSHL